MAVLEGSGKAVSLYVISKLVYKNIMVKLYKHISSSHAEMLLSMGTIRIGTLYEYKKIEDKELQDQDEGTAISVVRHEGLKTYDKENIINAPTEIQNMFLFNEKSGPINLYNVSIGQKYKMPDAWIFCLSQTKAKIFEKYDSCIEITDPNLFSKVIYENIVKLGNSNIQFQYAPMNYAGRIVESGKRKTPMFLKNKKYQLEEEYRFAFVRKNPFITELKPIIFSDYRLTHAIKRIR